MEQLTYRWEQAIGIQARDDAPLAVVSALVAILVGACASAQAPPAQSVEPAECTQAADCIGGLACIDGVCSECSHDRQCEAGSCEEWGRCSGGPYDGPCRDASDCAPEVACVLNQCQGCNVNEDCQVGVCLDTTHVCGGKGSCNTDDDCLVDEICDEQLCIFSA